MARKLVLPHPSTLDLAALPPGLMVFLQAMYDALETVDANVLYRDQVNLFVPNTRVRDFGAKGAAISVGGTTVASGDEYVQFVAETRALLLDHNELRNTVKQLVEQLGG